LGLYDTAAASNLGDTFEDLIRWCGLGDESVRAGTHCTAHGERMVREAEHDYGSVIRIGCQRSHSSCEAFDLSKGVEQRDVGPADRLLSDIDFHDLNLLLAAPEESD
jgi:hypothetical protein